MADFSKAFPELEMVEGGHVDDSNDRGGETYKGIARKIFPGWDGWKIVDGAKKSAGTKEELESILTSDGKLQWLVAEFYKKTFWDIHRLDEFTSQRVASEVFEIGVNCGSGTAAKFLQRVLNALNRQERDWPDIPVDGKIGPKTVEMANRASIKREANIEIFLNVLQGGRYMELAERDDRYGESFINGWANRIRIRKV